MTTDSKNGNYKSTSFRVHVSLKKMFDEICKLYNFDGVNDISKTDHVNIMIRWYAESLKKKRIKPGQNVANKLFGK